MPNIYKRGKYLSDEYCDTCESQMLYALRYFSCEQYGEIVSDSYYCHACMSYFTNLRKNKLKDAYFNKISKYFSEERFI